MKIMDTWLEMTKEDLGFQAKKISIMRSNEKRVSIDLKIVHLLDLQGIRSGPTFSC